MSVTSLDLDDEALAEAMRLSGLRTKKDVVNAALREYSARHRRIEALERYAQAAEGWDHEDWERRHAAGKGPTGSDGS
ncbi:type II toxin-antitoxin system VapB family antitoxin [Streptomyces sp. PTM05]|uniref:Type II toxin-antitoxin system VapB family antitoxin n=1 Tax=Streptantibioticus parmotrematis TaxID=2873249 RepID=A0ABS7QN89_9ACTN|nr:type II toxin-antitoxin system VapB family antitoxin [Streptantibioticus parmotrematis]MBY8884661.1 type II toxin-antitoxin system VapB family antitoxin [Streptantibioticus parmotrematis]